MRRRQFLAATSAALSVTALPMAARAGVRRYAVTAAPASQKLGGADRPATGLWLYDGVSPGPMIEAERGDDLEVVFTNRLDVPTTMHWHGIRNLNEMDGVPDLTQAAVEPGESFTYRFPLRDSGTSGTTPTTRDGSSLPAVSTGPWWCASRGWPRPPTTSRLSPMTGGWVTIISFMKTAWARSWTGRTRAG